MDLLNVIHMNGSEHGVNSYANNSTIQRRAIRKARPMIEQTLKTMQLNKAFPEKCFVMADMGCSTGPNTLEALSRIIDAIVGLCHHKCPEIQVFLNDLPGNDFNSIFRSLPDFYNKGGVFSSCYISGTAGSFYERLFPASSLHFVHSSYSLHYLSQVPEGIEENKGHIHVARESPRNIFEAYRKQFTKDFSKFLSHRAVELKPRGSMILVLIGRSTDDPSIKDCCLFWELLSKSLLDMAAEGKIEEGVVESFNLPFYSSSKTEVKEIVERQGAFDIERLESFEEDWDYVEVEDIENYMFDKQKSGQKVASYIRAVAESSLTSHFGGKVIDDLFVRYAEYVGEHLSVEKEKFVLIAISVTKNN